MTKFQRTLHPFIIGVGDNFFRNSLSSKDIRDLSNTDSFQICFHQIVKQGILRWDKGKIAAVCGADEGVRGIADKWAGNDPSHTMFSLHDLSGSFTDMVKFLEWDFLFMGSNL